MVATEVLSDYTQKLRMQQNERRTKHFLKGPIYLDWLATASRAGGKALAVGTALWFQAGLQGTKTFKIRGGYMRRMGVGRKAVSRSLHRLAEVGLLRLDSQRGRSPVVELYDRPPNKP